MSNLMPKGDKPEQDRPAQTGGDPEDIAMGRIAAGEGYVRLRLRYDKGTLSVVSAKRVPGPLLETEKLEEGYIYEVRRGRRRIYSETIPDLGVERSFPPPEGRETEEVQGHHITVLDIYEFNVRIPASEFTRRNLRNLEVTLYQTGELPTQVLTAPEWDTRPLGTQFGGKLRPIGTLKGVDPVSLPDEVRKKVDEALR